MRRFFGAALAAVLSLSASTAMADVVKIGLIADFTGAFATWGTQFQQAIEAYQAVHGKTVKGPDGKVHEIQFVYRDTASAGPGQDEANGRRAGTARKGEDACRLRPVASGHGGR